MGFYRFLLAVSVVFFHVGGGTWVIGRVAVFCFYFISGFLIFRVLDTSYRGGLDHTAAFYVNRALRLFPLYILLTYATILLFTLHGKTLFPVEPPGGEHFNLLNRNIVGDFLPGLRGVIPLPIPDQTGLLPVISSAPDAIPQGWSIAIELAFYAIAPLVALLLRRRASVVVALAVAATLVFVGACLAAPDARYVDNYIYKNAVTSLFMFLWGGVAYVVWRDTDRRIPLFVTAPVVAAFGYYILVWSASRAVGTRDPAPIAFLINILLGIPVTAMVCFTAVPKRLQRLETSLGDLSYGIYLNHFIVAGAMLIVAEAYGEPLFGRYNRLTFGLWAILFSVMLAFVTFHAVERPVEILRRSIKGRPRTRTPTEPQAAPAAALA